MLEYIFIGILTIAVIGLFIYFQKRMDKMATTIEAVQQFAAQIDAATTELANDLQALKDQLAGAGTPEEVQAILQPVLDRLNNLGQQQ